jgi:hypothetical protein
MHYNKKVRFQVEAAGWKIMYNAIYSPQYHCIKYYFNIVKKIYRDKVIERNFKMTT